MEVYYSSDLSWLDSKKKKRMKIYAAFGIARDGKKKGLKQR